jgi:hypothetical protein
LAQIFYPIYMNEKVSLQCMTPQRVEIDGEDRYCDQTSLQFGPFPQEIKVDDKVVLALHIPHHFSMKLAWMAEDFSSITLFKETNTTGTPFGQNIIGFFETAQPIHYSLLGMSCVVVLVLVILCCCASYLNCPSMLAKLFCCCSNRCGLKQKVLNRTVHFDNLPVPNVSIDPRAREQLLLEMNQNPMIPDSETSFMIPQTSQARQTGVRMVQGPPILKNQAPSAPVDSELCRYGYMRCFCLRDRTECRGPMGRPPPY